MIRSIIFDMDGTLLDSSFAMTCTVNHIRESLGLEPISKEYLEFHINQPDIDLPMKFYGVKEYTQAHHELFRKHYIQNSNLYVQPYVGARELLQFLKNKNITLSIATNASDFFAKHMLANCDMLDYFDFIVGANNVKNRKPEPDMFHHIIENSSIDTKQSIVIGDSIKDELAAKNADIEFLFADWGYGTSDTAKIKIQNIDKLRDYLQDIL
ncbi:MAG: HAD family hydrolase [Sulfurospirillaceae bacterium]|nr:HAD family hydrolase [Sulfurospirillaceae bacterium]